jgi:oligosaccharide repeat unit polymerase
MAPIILLSVSLVVAFTSLFYILDGGGVANWTMVVAAQSLIWGAAYMLTSHVYHKSIYQFASAYILPLVLFHLGITIPDAFGLFDGLGWPEGSMNIWFEMSGYFTVLALGALGVGISLSMLLGKKEERTLTPLILYRTQAIAYYDGLWLLAVSVAMLGLAIGSMGNLLNYNRVDFFRATEDTRGLGVLLMTFPSCLVLLGIGARTRRQKMLGYSICLIGAILLLLSGYRASAMFPAIIAVVLWVKTGRRVPLLVAGAAIIIVTIIIPASGALRSAGTYADITFEGIGASLDESTLQETFRTMGQTGGVAAHVYRLVPRVDPYRYGDTYVDAFTNAFPNILPEMGENKRLIGKNKAYTDEITNTIPSDWLTYRIAKDKFDRGEGVGFSGVAEPYLNFGWIGIIAYFSILGFLLNKIDQMNLVQRPNIILFGAAMYWPLMRSVRNDFATFVKPAVFILIFIVFWRLACKSFPGLRPELLKVESMYHTEQMKN